jgi:hypothetical protein
MLRTTILSLAAVLAAAACAPLSAQPLVDLDVVDRDSGQWLPELPHRGRTWIPGVPGHRYAVRLTNTSDERVLVVLSVDGVNAVTGATAAPSQAGYVLDPRQSAEIAGWRKSLDDVAQFVFTDLPDSYAARTGRPDNVGVIGIAVFREARPVAWEEEPPAVARDDAAPAAPAAQAGAAKAASEASADAARQRIGTGHGAREWSPVARTDFIRASSRPAQVTQLRYDDVDRLVALGVLPRRHRYWQASQPDAFPGDFVADPPRW